jgi:hypothetical protein
MSRVAAEPWQSQLTTFMQGIRKLGWIEAENVETVVRWSEGDPSLIHLIFISHLPPSEGKINRTLSKSSCSKITELHQSKSECFPLRQVIGDQAGRVDPDHTRGQAPAGVGPGAEGIRPELRR